MINPFESLQVLEKNHFLAGQNRSTVPAMIEIRYPDPRWCCPVSLGIAVRETS
jgi:hypothetical protein